VLLDENICIISFPGKNNLRVFVNKVPRRMNGPKRGDVFRKPHNEKPNNL